jgi:hypothetical protein
MSKEKFLSESEYNMIWDLMVSKGFPMFHLIAFTVDETGRPKFNMVSGLTHETDCLHLLEIVELFHEQLKKMCSSIADGYRYPDPDKDDFGNPRGSC